MARTRVVPLCRHGSLNSMPGGVAILSSGSKVDLLLHDGRQGRVENSPTRVIILVEG